MSTETTELSQHQIVCNERRQRLEKLLAIQPIMEAIVAAIPQDIIVGLTDTWVQISSPDREQVFSIMAALSAGRWEKKLSEHHEGGRVDYRTKIEGVEVLMYGAEPPTSCRIEVEEIDVPAHKEIRRKLICA